jgi:hypothetical protein
LPLQRRHRDCTDASRAVSLYVATLLHAVSHDRDWKPKPESHAICTRNPVMRGNAADFQQ